MKSIDKLVSNNKDINYKLRLSYDEARKDESVKNLIDSIDLPDEELMKHTSAFEASAKEFNNCKGCKNISACKNDMTGYCYLPILEEGRLNFSYVACKYKNKIIKENKYLKNVNSIDIPKEIREAKIKDIYTDDKNRQEVIKWILNYVKAYKQDIHGKGIYLHGNFGCGKTYLVAAMFNELAKTNVKSTIVYWPEYLRSLKASFQSTSNDEFNNKFNEVKYANILLIDDLGAEAVTAWNRDEVLGTILQYRMQENLPTFITSNLNLKEMEEHLSVVGNKSEKVKAVRIMERIKQLTIDTEMVSKNNRK